LQGNAEGTLPHQRSEDKKMRAVVVGEEVVAPSPSSEGEGRGNQGKNGNKKEQAKRLAERETWLKYQT